MDSEPPLSLNEDFRLDDERVAHRREVDTIRTKLSFVKEGIRSIHHLVGVDLSSVKDRAFVENIKATEDLIDLSYRVYGEYIELNEDEPRQLFVASYFSSPSYDRIRDMLSRMPPGDESGSNWRRYAREIAEICSEQLRDALKGPLRIPRNAQLNSRAVALSSEVDTKLALDAAQRARESIDEAVEEAKAHVGQAVEEATSSATHVKEIAGTAAQGDLALKFQGLADKETTTANIARGAVITILIATFALLGWLLFLEPNGDISWTDLTRRIALPIPGLILAVYLSKEASRHRSVADWARALEVQLRTINAYTDPLEPADRQDIRAFFGRRVFSSPELRTDDKSQMAANHVQGAVQNVSSAVQALRAGRNQ